MPARIILLLGVLVLLMVSCQAKPETIVETVIVESTVEVEVTRIVQQEIEVTRVVEVTREVEVPAEVTRIVAVERLITATPAPTPQPTMTKTAVPAVILPATPTAVKNQSAALLEQMLQTRTEMANFGGQIDAALLGGPFSCLDAVNTYDAVTSAPMMEISSSYSSLQTAYRHYRASIDIFRDGAWDMVNNCRQQIAGSTESAAIPSQQLNTARHNVDEAIDVLSPGIRILGGE